MHECYAMQILEKQRDQKQQRRMVTKSRAMKHKDHKSQRMIRDTDSHQLLDEVSQTYFYQEVW